MSLNLHSYLTRFQQINKELEQRSGNIVTDVVSSIGKEAISEWASGLPLVKKSDVRKSLDKRSSTIQHEDLENRFDILYRDLLDELSMYKIIDKESNVLPTRTTAYVSKVRTVTTLKTKIRHVLKGLSNLIEIQNRLIKKDQLIQKKNEISRKKTQAELLWEKILKDDITAIQKLDESEYFERKREIIKDQKIKDTILALHNTEGGIIVFGIDDKKNLTPLELEDRDKIEQLISNICTHGFLNQIKPKFHIILTEKQRDVGILCIFVPKFIKFRNGTRSGRYLWRIGSNNQPVPPDKKE